MDIRSRSKKHIEKRQASELDKHRLFRKKRKQNWLLRS